MRLLVVRMSGRSTGASFSLEDHAQQDNPVQPSNASSPPGAAPAMPLEAQRILFMRFCQQEDLRMFRQGPAQSLLNELGVPLVLAVAFAVQPAQKTQTRSR